MILLSLFCGRCEKNKLSWSNSLENTDKRFIMDMLEKMILGFENGSKRLSETFSL